MSDLIGFNVGRRAAIKFTAAISFISMSGCCSLFGRNNPSPRILGEIPKNLQAILSPPPIKTDPKLPNIIDVHAHFFNAKDVPVGGYMGGPVAHSRKGIVKKLLIILSKYAEWITQNAPSAEDEFNLLISMSSIQNLKSLDATQRALYFDQERDKHLKQKSEQFYHKLKNDQQFISAFNEAVREDVIKLGGNQFLVSSEFNELSLYKSMEIDLQRDSAVSKKFIGSQSLNYPDGVLAFVGYMLSYRWMNLRAYQKAYSTDDGAFGITQVLGVLVDFNQWLCPPARTAQEDQIKLHQLISELSGGYMRPVVAFNPRLGQGETKEQLFARVLDALDNRGFVGVKIYPPNGFRPYGNKELKLPSSDGPSGELLDETMLELWTECEKRGVPVMAHTGESMGSDDAYNAMAEPVGWESLIKKFKDSPVRINLGHFGGEDNKHQWTESFTSLMKDPAGKYIYADVGYWETKDCQEFDNDCDFKKKLSKLTSNYPDLKHRLMFGTDWLMLSQEVNWSRYPFKIKSNLPSALEFKSFFGDNALNCFPKLNQTNSKGE